MRSQERFNLFRFLLWLVALTISLPLLAARAVPGVRSAATAAGARSTSGPGSAVAWGFNDFGQCNIPANLTDVTAVASNWNQSLALKSNGTVVAWGRNNLGQGTVPAGLTGVVAIAVGYQHSLALKSDGTVVAWGDDSYGQSTVPAGLTGVTAISCGAFHSLALKSDGTVVAWGTDFDGSVTVPAGLTGVIAISAGRTHNLALKSDGTVVAWGTDTAGQSTVPAGLTGVVAISAGHFHSLALKSDGTVVAWGGNNYGQIIVPAGLTGVTAIAAGGYHSLVLKSDGTVAVWGRNDSGQSTVPAGLASVTHIAAGENYNLVLRGEAGIRAWGKLAGSVPAGLTGVTAVTGGLDHSLALQSNGTVVGWGSNFYLQLDIPAGLSGVTAISARSYHSLALKADGTVKDWGSHFTGAAYVPAGLTGVTAVAAGGGHSLALKSDGTVVAWGADNYGQSTVPAGLTGVVAIAAGYVHSLALKADGTVVAWGADYYGQRTVPAGLTGVIAISCGDEHNLALKSDGTLVAWGRSLYDLTNTQGLTGVAAIATGGSHNLVLKSDGTVVSWGWGGYGEAAVPADLPAVGAIGAGGNASMALVPVPSAAPTVNAPGAQQTLEDTATGQIPFTVGDTDTPVANLTVSAASSVPGLVQTFNYGGSDANRTVQIVPATNQNGTATITLTVSDGANSTTATFPFTVQAVNDAPSFTKGADQTVAQNAGPQTVAGWATSLSPGPTSDEYTQNLTFQVTGNTNPGLFSAGPAINGTTGDLTYTSSGTLGTATITLVLKDDGGTANSGADTSESQTFTITVNGVPTATGESYTLPWNQPYSVAAPGVLANDSDPGSLALTALKVTDPAHGTVTLNGDGSFTYTPTANYFGTDSFTYRAQNNAGGQSTPATVSFTVGSGYTLTAPASGSAGSPLTVSWTAPAGHSGTDWIGVYRSGSSGPSGYLTWQYIGSATSGTQTITVAEPGNYVFRLYLNDGAVLGAVSSTVTVTGAAPSGFTLTAPNTVAAGGSLTVTWSAPVTRSATDWIGFYPQNAAGPSGYLAWVYTNGQASGMFTVTAPTTGGPFLFRYYQADSATLAAASNTVTLTGVNSAPTITLDNPGGPFAAPASVTLAATASDSDGTVAKVEFYAGNNLLGQSTTPNAVTGKYEFNWTGVAAGSYTVTARATDNAGAITASSTYPVTVTGTPVITVTLSPGTVAAGGSYTVSWTAPAGSAAADWIGIYASSNPGPTGYVTWFYTGGATSGTRTLTAPATAGQYLARYFLNDSSTLGATSGTITVTGVTPSFTVTPNVTTITTGGMLTVNWTASAGRPAHDWVALVRTDQLQAGSPQTISGYVKWAYTGGATSGSALFNLTGVAPGTYYCVYLLNDGTTVGAVSAQVTVQ